MLFLPGSGIFLLLVPLQLRHLLGVCHVLGAGTSLVLVSFSHWYLYGFDISLVLAPLWLWLLPGSGLSLVLESLWCFDLAQEMCCTGGIDPDVTFAQLPILYTPGLGNSREDREAGRKPGLAG